tara:strand:- start:29 stop:715 length:687 start_codon:yes stop_codon:yes gene_type:complete
MVQPMQAGFHLHAPKTGGTSIIFALLTNSNEFKETYGHYYKNRMDGLFDSPLNIPHDVCYCPDHKKFITFGIRNPYDRMLSLIKQVNKQTSQLQNEGLHTTEMYTLKSHLAEIRRYNKIDWNNFYEGHSPPHWAVIATLSQWEDTLCCNCGIKYIRFKNLVADFQTVYPGWELPHKMKFDAPLYVKENFDSQEILDKFNQIHETDFSRYSYTMITDINDLYQKYQINS